MKVKLFASALVAIAVVIVLLILPGNCVSQQGGPVPCLAFSGFACYQPVVNYDTGNLTISIGQNLGLGNWTNVTIIFVPSTYANGTFTNSSSQAKKSVYLPAMYENQMYQVTTNLANPNSCDSITDSIWARDQINGKYTAQKIAELNLAAYRSSYLGNLYRSIVGGVP